jgi:hypothetical protein
MAGVQMIADADISVQTVSNSQSKAIATSLLGEPF